MQIFKQLVTVSMFLFLSKGMLFAQTAGINYQALILNSEVIQIPGADIEQNQIPLGLEGLRFNQSSPNDYQYHFGNFWKSFGSESTGDPRCLKQSVCESYCQ